MERPRLQAEVDTAAVHEGAARGVKDDPYERRNLGVD